jgi:signal transduction histidine kinase
MERFGRGDRGARAEEAGLSELRDVAQRFNEMATSIGSQYDAQIAFFGGVAHDLRNPLSVLKMSLGMVRPGQVRPPEPDLQRIFEIVDRQIMRLECMVGDFLDIAKIEAGQLELRRELQDVRGLISDTCDLFQGSSPEHPIEVSAPDEPVLLRCDPLRIEQVVSNLISNAIKYSPGGGTVWVALTRTAEEATIAVTDQGIGISAEDQRRLFEPFRRAGPSRETIPGVGLGLFVTRTIVEGHGGRIEIESRPEKGSTFLVYLPLDLDARSAPVSAA